MTALEWVAVALAAPVVALLALVFVALLLEIVADFVRAVRRPSTRCGGTRGSK